MRKRALAPVLLALSLVPAAHAFDQGTIIPGTGTIRLAFPPEQDAAGLVVDSIDAARDEVLVQAFSFTHAGIAAALVRAQRRGVRVEVLADPQQIELIEHNVVGKIAAGGVAVYTDPAHASAHDKVVVVDASGEHPAVVTGSFNFTFAAQYRNAENLLVIRDNGELARAYRENWERHRAHSAPYGGSR